MSDDSRQIAHELDNLKQRVLTMAEAAEERLRTVMHALVERDHSSLAAVIAGDARIDHLQIEIDDACFKLLALHQPVAIDLRTVVSSLKVNADRTRRRPRRQHCRGRTTLHCPFAGEAAD